MIMYALLVDILIQKLEIFHTHNLKLNATSV